MHGLPARLDPNSSCAACDSTRAGARAIKDDTEDRYRVEVVPRQKSNDQPRR